jgi:predicted nucleotidyltransferase
MSEIINKIDLDFIKIGYFKRRLKKYLEELKNIPLDIEGILLFGSVANGREHYDDDYISDIDLIIISRDLPEDLWLRNEELFKLTYRFDSGIQAIWWTPEEADQRVKNMDLLALDAFDEGRILVDEHDFLKNLKKKLASNLKKKGVIKKKLYWQWPITNIGEEIEF